MIVTQVNGGTIVGGDKQPPKDALAKFGDALWIV